MNITFVVGGYSPVVVGGVKVVYEYANHLQDRGHQVTIVHPYRCEPRLLLRQRVKALAWKARTKVIDRPLVPWFTLRPDVQVLLTPDLRAHFVPDSDAIIATGWAAAEWMVGYPQRKGCKFHIVQEYEYYMTAPSNTKARMTATYLGGARNVAISPAVVEMLETCGALVSAYIPNGLDLHSYKLKASLQTGRYFMGFPCRDESFKGTADAVEALRMIRAEGDLGLHVWTFGKGRRPHGLPSWIEYHELPTDRALSDLYNKSKIFLVPSHFEGWGLPGSEAMACGAALVSTDNGGVRAYAEHRKTALLSPPKDPAKLAYNVTKLLRDDELRIRLAACGHDYVQQFTWDRATRSLEELVEASRAMDLR